MVGENMTGEEMGYLGNGQEEDDGGLDEQYTRNGEEENDMQL